MPKYNIEVPVFVFLHIEMEGEDEEDAAMKVTPELIYKTAHGAVAATQGHLSVSLDPFDWGNYSVEEAK